MKLFHIQLLVTSIRLSFPLRIFWQHFFLLRGHWGGGDTPLAEKISQVILKRAHLHLHLLTFVDDQPQLQVGQKPLLLILRWHRPTLVQVAGGKGAAKRSGWRDPPTSGWWVVASKMSLSSGGGAAHYGFHRPGWIL